MARVLDREGDIQGAIRSAERKTAMYEWMKKRSEALRSSVSAYDILRRFGTHLKQSGDSHEEQLPCPFHGKDNKPSARIYPDGPRSSSHLWCFTCQKRWDIFGLWRNYMQHGEEIRFSQIIFEIERAFGVTPPEPPAGASIVDEGPSEQETDVERLFETCEFRLRVGKSKYEPEAFFRTGQLLDQLHYKYDNRVGDVTQIEVVLRKVLDKIGDRIRA